MVVSPVCGRGFMRRSAFIAFGILSCLATMPCHAFEDWTVGLNGYQPKERDAAYYRTHARPERGELQVAPAGTWLVETDRETGLAEPRLITLGSGQSVVRANQALQAVH